MRIILGRKAQIFGSWSPSWASLGTVLGPSWVVLGASWTVLGPSRAVPGPSWGPFWPSWGDLGGLLGRLGKSDGRKGEHAKIIQQLIGDQHLLRLGGLSGALWKTFWGPAVSLEDVLVDGLWGLPEAGRHVSAHPGLSWRPLRASGIILETS